MKYIRTKNGKIYKALKDYMQSDLPPTKIRVENVAKDWNIIISKSQVVKQADTIEELCDAFVDTSELKTTNTGDWLYDEFDSDNKCLVYYEHDERKTISLNEFDDLSKIRGAIWTDKGLIFKAKMKGVLPNGEIDWELL